MERSMFTDAELQLTTERSAKYQGTAKINLSQIAFHPSLSREVDQKNVERLCEIFNKDGCRRLDIRHHVTAVVSPQHLANALCAAHVTAHALMTNPPDRYPQLQFPAGQIRCLHGQHRLKAGEELLPPSDQWWTVDLYLDDISSGLQASLVDEYSNEKPPSDGEVYRKVRQYQYEANARFEERWKSRLSSNKARRFRQLCSPAHVDVRAAFDALLAIPGLWNGMNLGSLHRVLALNCDEEIVTYLAHVKQFWSSLVDDDHDKMTKIDLHTVEILQLLAPGVSRKDAKTVRGVVLGGEAFANFNDSDRAAIWNKLQGKREIIPSIHTLFQDIYYLEACANCVKRLVVLSKLRPTLRSAVWGILKPSDPAVGNCMIQTSETGQRRSASPAQRAELGYRQLWLYAMRHYPKMPREPESDDLVAKPGHEKADETALHEMAVLAQKLGFDSTRITDLIELSPDRQIARAVLLKARDPERFRYDSGIFEILIGRIAECFSLAVPVERQLSCDFTSGSEAKLNARCGLPHARAQQQDSRFLFIDQLHTDEMLAGGKVSTLFVRRCVYFAFFGKPLTSPPPHRTWVGAAPLGSDPSNLQMSPLFVPDDSPLAGFGQAPVQENDGCTTIDHCQLGPMQLEAAERAAAEETRVRTEVEEWEIALQAEQAREQAALTLAQSQKEAKERAATDRYAAEQEQLRQEEETRAAEQYAMEQEQLQQEEEARAAAEQYAMEQEQLQQEEEARAAAEQYAMDQEQLRQEEEETRAAEQYAMEQEQLQQEEEARAAAEQYAMDQEQLRQEEEETRAAEQYAMEQEQLQQEEEARAAAEQYAMDQEQLRQEEEETRAAEQYAMEQEQLQQEEEARAAAEQYAVEQEQLQQEEEARAAAEQYSMEQEQLQQEEEARAAAEQYAMEQEQLQQEEEARAAAEQYAMDQEQLRQEEEETRAAEQYAMEQEQLQQEEEARAAAQQYVMDQEELQQEQLRQKEEQYTAEQEQRQQKQLQHEEEARAAAKQYAVEQEQLQQEEEARAAAEQYAVEQEQLQQEEEARAAAEQYAMEQKQLQQEEEARAAAQQYVMDQEELQQEQLRQKEEQYTAEQEQRQQKQLQHEEEARAAAEQYAVEQEQLQQEEEARAAAEQYSMEQEQLQQEEEARAAAEQYAMEQKQLQQEEEARAAAQQYVMDQEELQQEQLRQKEEQYTAEQEQRQQKQLQHEEEARAAAKQYAVELEQLRQQEEEKLATEQYVMEQEELKQEQLKQNEEQYAVEQEQLQQKEEAKAAAEQYAAEQGQLQRDAEEAAAEQVKREQILRKEEERRAGERAEQEQLQKKAEGRAAIEHAAAEARLQQEAEERVVAEQAGQERLAREGAEAAQLQSEGEERAVVLTAAEETHTPRPVTQLDFTAYMPSKGDGTHSTVDPASTERATNVADPPSEVESTKAAERTTRPTRLEGPVSQTRQGKLRRPGGIPKASEGGAAERSLKTSNRLQGSKPDSQLQGASRLEDVSTGTRTVTIIFKAREEGNWVDTYKMTINPSEPSDRSIVERMAKKDARNRQATFYDKDLKPIAPIQCFDAAIEDGTNTVFMAFGGELNVDEEMVASVSQDANSETKQERKTKRRA